MVVSFEMEDDNAVTRRLSVTGKLYDADKKGFLTNDEQMLRNLDKDGDGKLDVYELAPFVNRHNELRQDNAKLRRNQWILGGTTILFGIATIVVTLLAIQASKDTVVSSDGLLSSKETGMPVVTQSKGVSIVSKLQHSSSGDNGFSDGANTENTNNECVSMEDVASMYKAFGEGTDMRILTNDSSVSGLNDGHITFPVTKVEGSSASINDTHVTIGDAIFDIAADNPCNKGSRKYPYGPRKLFHDHLHGRHRKLQSDMDMDMDMTRSGVYTGESKAIYDAVIIGAGWAGISAAANLKSEGLDNILILEGRDYIGGRSRTVFDFVPSHPDMPFELGSEFIYTSYPNDILDIFEDKKIHSKEATLNSVMYDPALSDADESMGSRVDDALYDEMASEFWKNGFVKYLQKQNLYNTDSGYGSLLRDFERENSITDEDEKQFLLMETNGHIVIEFAEDAEGVSARGTHNWLEEVDTVSMNVVSVPGGGYSRAIDSVVADHGIAEKTTLNAKVHKVSYGEENQLVKIDYTRDGDARSVRARTVLVTVPLGVLQSGDIEFSPPLPSDKQDLIDSMEIGVLDKLILYWDDDAMAMAPNFQSNWDAVSDKMWMELVTPETETSEIWTAFLNTRRFNGLHTMTAWIGGSAADAMELLDDQAIVDSAVDNLRTMFGSDVVPPTKFMITRWGTDEFSRGSYSYRSVDLDFDVVAGKLSRSVDDTVFFAGEHTSDSGWQGTAVGALETGRMAAKSMEQSIIRAPEVLVSLSYSKYS